MKKSLKVSLIVIGILMGIILLDSIQALIFNNNIIIGIETKCMKKEGLLVDTYHCSDGKNITKFKLFNSSCDSESVCGHNIIKPNLFNRDEIIKVVIDDYSQYDNQTSYSDKEIIDEIYNIFINLETTIESTSINPEYPEELYKVIFFNDDFMLAESDNDIFKSTVEVYRKNNKYYAEEINNGIYEITEDDFNIIKNYSKK